MVDERSQPLQFSVKFLAFLGIIYLFLVNVGRMSPGRICGVFHCFSMFWRREVPQQFKSEPDLDACDEAAAVLGIGIA